MLKPRNTVIVLDIIEQKERKVGGIVLPDNHELYAEAEVIAVGPGGGNVAGGHTETFDLKEGQRVFLQHKRQGRGPGGHPVQEIAGVRYIHAGKTYYLYEQTAILGIIAEPGQFVPTPQPDASTSDGTAAKSSLVLN